MATIVTRAGKGSALTFQEADDNFTNLNADGTANAASIVTLQNDKLDKSGGVMTGALTVNANLVAGGKVLGSVSNNSQSGSTVTITAPSTEIVRLTNVLLVSVSGIAAGSNGQKLVLVNRSGTTVTIENESSSASLSDQIFTGSGAPLSLNDKASISLLYDGTTSRWNIIGGTGSATGSGGINYILNGDASIGTTGWNAYNDGAVAAPIDGTGGTPSAGLWVRSTTTPLRGSGDFNLVKTGSTSYQGQGVSYDFTIDNADLAKVLTVTFDYEVLSGTYANGDLTVYLIQDPAGTPVVIQPAGYTVLAATVGTKMKQIATFQTASNVTSYRLCFHIASTSALDYSLAIDTVSVGPQVVQYGAPVTDWQSYTPTFTGFGTASSVAMYWRRSGDSIEIKGRFTSGTSTATEARVSFPSGLTSDSSKVSTIELCGAGEINTIGSVGQNVGVSYAVLAEPSVGYVTFSARSSGSTGLSKLNGNSILSSGSIFTIEARVPILGWSSTVQMSNDTDTRVVAANYKKTANQAVTGNVTDISFDSRQFDTHGAWTGSAYVAPVPGYYSISGSMNITTATSVNLAAFVNGTARQIVGTIVSGNNVTIGGLVYLEAGQSLSIRSEVNITILGNAATLGPYLAIQRLSGPSQIAASETVAASYWVSANQAITANVTTINYDTREFDSHGMVTTGAGWVATIPISGTYLFTGSMVASSACNCVLYKNGVAYKYIGSQAAGASGSNSATVRLVAGDQISFRGNTSVTVTGAASLANNPAHIGILRVGN